LITDWLATPSPDQNILWLHGLAGSGKSTIATTVAEYFRGLGRLGAFLIFDRSKNSDPTSVVRTMAYRLAYCQKSIGAAVCAAIQRNPGCMESSMSMQFVQLLLEPLGSVPGLLDQGPIIIILDALDQCGDVTSRKTLLGLLASELSKLPAVFRILITSRREFDIESAFSQKPNVIIKEIDIMESSNTSDIEVFLCHHLASMQRVVMFELPSDWPGESNIQQLVKTAAGLFIWASTAIRFIESSQHPQQGLDDLLNLEFRSEAKSALDTLYEMALQLGGIWQRKQVADDFCAVLGAVVVLQIPLSDTVLDQMLGLHGTRSSRFILSRLLCLLNWSAGRPIHVLHSSFTDYLSSPNRCGLNPWFIDKQIYHQKFTFACLQIMKMGLHFNICSLETSHIPNKDISDLSSIIDQKISGDLLYSCRFWANHLQSTDFDLQVCAAVQDFLYNKTLYWLEVLSLLGEVNNASPALFTLIKWITVSLNFCQILKCSTIYYRIVTQKSQHLQEMQLDWWLPLEGSSHKVCLISTCQCYPLHQRSPW
jgi:hypothetical protein